MKKKTPDYLPNLPYKLYQDDAMFTFNTDTVLLGNFLDRLKGLSILDIGTNNGALLLYAHFKGALKLCGIELFDRAIALAKHNLQINNIDNYELFTGDVRLFKHEPFDAIICNPPFFQGDLKPQNPYKQVALFADNLAMKELFQSAYRLLKDNGSFYGIYDARSLYAFFKVTEELKWKIVNLQLVYDYRKDHAIRFLFKIKKGQSKELRFLKPIFIKDGKIIDNY